MSALFFEDFNTGDTFVTPRRTITETDIVNFAGVSGDFNPIHTDHVFGAETPFGTVVSHGLLIMSVATGLMSRLGVFDGSLIAMLGVEGWRFLKPVLIGDTVRVRMTILDKRPSADQDRGILRRQIEILNQRDEVAQVGVIISLCRRRAEADMAQST